MERHTFQRRLTAKTKFYLARNVFLGLLMENTINQPPHNIVLCNHLHDFLGLKANVPTKQNKLYSHLERVTNCQGKRSTHIAPTYAKYIFRSVERIILVRQNMHFQPSIAASSHFRCMLLNLIFLSGIHSLPSYRGNTPNKVL